MKRGKERNKNIVENLPPEKPGGPCSLVLSNLFNSKPPPLLQKSPPPAIPLAVSLTAPLKISPLLAPPRELSMPL